MRNVILPALLAIELGIFLPWSGIGLDSWQAFRLGALDYVEAVLTQAAPLLVLAFGMTVVLMTAGIDLSVGSMLALVACVMSTIESGVSFWYTAVPVGLLLGVALGSFNGLLIARLNVPPIIATLGTLFFYRGLCDVVMRGEERAPFYSIPGYEWFGSLGGTAVVVGLLYGVCGAWFYRSRWRREMLMLGGNRVAARYAGIPVFRRLFQVYAGMGALAFVAVLCATSKDGSVMASWRSGLELQVIVAVVLGGTPVDGGQGSMAGSFWGVLLIAVLEEGLRSVAMSDLSLIILGILLVAGMWLNTRIQARGKHPTVLRHATVKSP